jgi:hypothetical protein
MSQSQATSPIWTYCWWGGATEKWAQSDHPLGWDHQSSIQRSEWEQHRSRKYRWKRDEEENKYVTEFEASLTGWRLGVVVGKIKHPVMQMNTNFVRLQPFSFRLRRPVNKTIKKSKMCTNVCKPFKNKYLTRYIYWVWETAVLTSMKKLGVPHRLRIPRISSAACWPAQIKGFPNVDVLPSGNRSPRWPELLSNRAWGHVRHRTSLDLCSNWSPRHRYIVSEGNWTVNQCT